MERDRGIYQDYIIKTTDGIKVHFIMLDIRFDFNATTKDRIGEHQCVWLDELFRNNTDADVTIISAGV